MTEVQPWRAYSERLWRELVARGEKQTWTEADVADLRRRVARIRKVDR